MIMSILEPGEKANSIKVNVIVIVAVADTIVKFSPNRCYL